MCQLHFTISSFSPRTNLILKNIVTMVCLASVDGSEMLFIRSSSSPQPELSKTWNSGRLWFKFNLSGISHLIILTSLQHVPTSCTERSAAHSRESEWCTRTCCARSIFLAYPNDPKGIAAQGRKATLPPSGRERNGTPSVWKGTRYKTNE